MPGISPKQTQHAGRNLERARIAEQLTGELRADDSLLSEARVTSKPAPTERIRAGICETRPSPIESSVNFCSDSAERQAHLQNADRETANDVDERDDDARNGISADELRSSVHRAVEVGFLLDLHATGRRGDFVDDAGVQLGIDGHLFTGQSIEGEPRTDFGDTAGTLRDDDEVDDDQDQENDCADDVVALNDEVTERLDHLAGVAVHQHLPRRADIQRQTEKRERQEQGRKRRRTQADP